MAVTDPRATKVQHIIEIVYLSFLAFSFYLLLTSRTGEAHTIWEVLNPAFLPTLFVTTFLLITILLTSEKTALTLFFIIVYSILVHLFFSVIFPAGDSSGQQLILGRVRRVFDNTAPNGWSGLPTTTALTFIYELFKGINLQAAISTIFARMFRLDILYVHLFLVPVLWGAFVPVGAFLVAKAAGGNGKTSLLSGLLVSAFPYTVYFGAISVPNSLGFIFFLYSLYFMLKYLSSDGSKNSYLMLVFSLFSFLAHYLAGIMSVTLLLLAVVFKVYTKEKKSELITSRVLLIVSFLLCVSILPLSFIYLRFIAPSTNAIFTLQKFYQLPFAEILGVFLLGDLSTSSDLLAILVNVIGPLIVLTCMIYLVSKTKRGRILNDPGQFYFLFMAFLIMIIDYGILKLFMSGLIINAERLWVFRDFIAAPFVGLAVLAAVSSFERFSKVKSPTSSLVKLKKSFDGHIPGVSGFVLIVNLLIPLLLGGWIVFSLDVAYPHVAPLQTTSYELEAAKYIDANTHEKYVVIGDVWAIYAGEMIVGINNPQAYYFGEVNKTGQDIFVNMTQNPSPQWMLLALSYTNASVAYFIASEPRLGPVQFNETVSNTEQVLPVFHVTGEGKLYVFSYRKG